MYLITCEPSKRNAIKMNATDNDKNNAGVYVTPALSCDPKPILGTG